MNYTLKRGLNVPVITVLDDSGRVIAADQRRVIRHIVQHGYGADVIFGVGTTGEWNYIANKERQRIMEIEVDEVRQINDELSSQVNADTPHQSALRTPHSTLDQSAIPHSAFRTPHSALEAWVGVNGKTRAEVLDNLDAAIHLGADAAVIAPLAIEDLNENEIVRFFHGDLTNLLESSKSELPVFLYDNADIATRGRAPHIRTRIVKQLSRLMWVRGIKVSAPRRVLGNYIKAALHYKQPGEFGIYIGNAMLIFDIYRPSHTMLGRFREGWRDYLLHSTPPIGVVSGPANVMPREWQKAWRVCWAGDEELTDIYQDLLSRFERICDFKENGRRVTKTIACLKYALQLDEVISSSAVGRGVAQLSEEQKKNFRENYLRLVEYSRSRIDSHWQTKIETCRLRQAY